MSANKAIAHDPGGIFVMVRRSLLGMFAQLAVMSVFINVLSLAAPIFVIQVYDRVVPHSGFETLKGLFIALMAVIVFDYIVKQARGRLVQMIALRVDVDLSRRLFDRLTGAPLSVLEGRSEADWRALQRDADAVRDTVAGPTALLMVDLPFTVLFIGLIALVAPPLGWVLIGMTPLFLALGVASSSVIGRSSQREHQEGQLRQAMTDEVISGRGTVKALGLGAALRARWENAQAQAICGAMRRGAHVDGFTHMGASLAMLLTALMTTVGAVAIIDQQMSIGGLIAANMLAARVTQPLTQLISLTRSIERFRSAASRLDKILDVACERSVSAVARPRPSGRLTLEKVSFTYEGERAPALEQATIAFPPGALTGVLGANGSGKSTLLKILQGLYTPESGRVLLDGADISQFGRDELSRCIGYAPQETFLFMGSIRDNIARGREDVSDEAVFKSAETADALSFIQDLPDGFGTRVGDGGRPLSQGQRQRLAMARALLDEPPVLLLDEPSAHLDFEAEGALADRLDTLKRGRSLVLVSHSRRLLERCDRIVVLHGGRVAMSGRAEEILPRRNVAADKPAAGKPISGKPVAGKPAAEDRQLAPKGGQALARITPVKAPAAQAVQGTGAAMIAAAPSEQADAPSKPQERRS